MRILVASVLLLAAAAAQAAAEGPRHELSVDLGDRPALQRGARLFVNYCLSCHSAQFMRYNRMGRDLGLSDEQVEENLMFASEKVGEPMTVAMRPADAKRWLGAAPPDLSVVARSRGPDWLYSFLLDFYVVDDPSRPTGVDNLTFPGTAMPHVLAELQGLQVLAEADAGEGGHGASASRLELAKPGRMNPAEYRKAVRDLVTFLTYMGEPAKLVRYGVGVWVVLFLAVFFVLSWALYKEYWKDVR